MRELLEFLANGGSIQYRECSFNTHKYRLNLGKFACDVCIPDVDSEHSHTQIEYVIRKLKHYNSV